MTYSNDRYAQYRASESGKKAIRAYESSEAAKARRLRYRLSPKGQSAEILRNTQRKLRNREIITAAKSVPCADCRQSFDTVCMDFHHIKGKKYTIGWGRYGPKALTAEIAKCIVLCANCHRLRHKRK